MNHVGSDRDESIAVLDPVTPELTGRSTLLDIRIAAEAAIRSLVAVFAGLAVTVGLSLVLWAVSTDTTADAEQFVRAAAGAFVLAHFGDIGIGSATLTLTPLLLTMLVGFLLAVGAGRGRAAETDAIGELIAVVSGAVAYGVAVGAVAVTLPSVGARDPAVGGTAALVALVALSIGFLVRGAALRRWLQLVLPTWIWVGLRSGVAAVGVLFAGAALILAIGVAMSFGTVAELSDRLSASAGDGLGLLVAGLAVVPNAVLAAAGYVTGTGFQIGAGVYSPLGSVSTDLPPFPILGAVPGNSGLASVGALSLVVPLLAGFVAALAVNRRITDRQEAAKGAGVAGAVAGLLAAASVAVGRGGVDGGAWAATGADGPQVGLVLAVVVWVIALSWTLAAGYGPDALASVRGVRRRNQAADDDGPTVDASDESDESDADETGADETGADEPGADESGADGAGENQASSESDGPALIVDEPAATEPAANPDPDSEPDADPDPDTVPDPAPDPDPVPDPAPDPDTAPDPAPDPEPAPDPAPGPATDPDTDSTPAPGSRS